MSGREFLVTRIVLNVGIYPVVCQRLIQVPLSTSHQLQRENLDDGLGQGSDLKDCIRRCGRRCASWTTLTQFTEDFRVLEFPVFDDPDADGWNVRLLQPVGKLFHKSEIDWCGLDGLGVSCLNTSQEKEKDEEQTQRQR